MVLPQPLFSLSKMINVPPQAKQNSQCDMNGVPNFEDKSEMIKPDMKLWNSTF